MLGTAFYVAMAVCGIDIGWQPDAQGDIQYIIQIEPEMVDTLRTGRPIEYDLPPEHRGVHRFRFQVGKEKPPRIGNPAPPQPQETAVRRTEAPPAGPATGEKTTISQPNWSVKQTLPPKQPAAQLPAETPRLELPGVPSDRAAEKPSAGSTGPFASQGVPPAIAQSAPPKITLSPPDKLPANLDSKPIPTRKAAFDEPASGGKSGPTAGPDVAGDAKLMAPLVITSCTAGGLLAVCVYLCWIYAGTRRRYQTLLADYYAAVGSLPGFGPTMADPSREE